MTMGTLTIAATVCQFFVFDFFCASDGRVDAVWSNFEIGDLDFWRGEAYMKFFNFLDQKGGFYYEVCGNGVSYCVETTEP